MDDLELVGEVTEGVGVSAETGGGVGVDVVADTDPDVEVGVGGDIGARLTTQVPWTGGSDSAIRVASLSEVTYPSEVT